MKNSQRRVNWITATDDHRAVCAGPNGAGHGRTPLASVIKPITVTIRAGTVTWTIVNELNETVLMFNVNRCDGEPCVGYRKRRLGPYLSACKRQLRILDKVPTRLLQLR